MQVFVFILIVTFLSLFRLDIIQSLFFSFVLLVSITLGQMTVGFLILLVDSFVYKLRRRNQEDKYESFLKKNVHLGIVVSRVIVFSFIILTVLMSWRELLLPTLSGILYWMIVEYLGEKSFRLKF